MGVHAREQVGIREAAVAGKGRDCGGEADDQAIGAEDNGEPDQEEEDEGEGRTGPEVQEEGEGRETTERESVG